MALGRSRRSDRGRWQDRRRSPWLVSMRRPRRGPADQERDHGCHRGAKSGQDGRERRSEVAAKISWRPDARSRGLGPDRAGQISDRRREHRIPPAFPNKFPYELSLSTSASLVWADWAASTPAISTRAFPVRASTLVADLQHRGGAGGGRAETGAAKTYGDYQDLRSPIAAVDAVVVMTPTKYHGEAVITPPPEPARPSSAEKPLTLDVNEGHADGERRVAKAGAFFQLGLHAPL